MSVTNAGMTAVLRWEEPPPSVIAARPRKPRVSKYEAVADELRARPGEWAVVFEGRHGAAGGMVTHIRLGQVRCFTPTGDFDATVRHRDGKSVVYARYVGEEDL